MANSRLGLRTRPGLIRSYTEITSGDPDANAFISAAGITDATQKNAIQQLVVDLKAYSIWTKMKAIWPFVGGTADTHKWNLKDARDVDAAFRLTFAGGITHSVTGALFNGTTGYAETFLNASTDITNGNFHLSFYSRTNTNTQAFSNEIVIKTAYSASGWVALRTNNKTSGNAGFSSGYDNNEFATASSTTSGFSIGTETSNSLRKFIKNNSILATNTTTSTTNITNTTFNLCGSILGGVYSNNQCAFASIGDGLNDAEAADLYTAVQDFQTTLSRQV